MSEPVVSTEEDPHGVYTGDNLLRPQTTSCIKIEEDAAPAEFDPAP